MMQNLRDGDGSRRGRAVVNRIRSTPGRAVPVGDAGSSRTDGRRLVVAIPSTGRARILPDTVRDIALQRKLPDLLILSLAVPEDIGDLDIEALPFPVMVVMGRKGATAQRNRVLRECTRDDIVLMLDDDFLMAPDYLQRTRDVFLDDPAVVLATGTVLADGIRGPGFDHAEGRALLAALNTPDLRDGIKPTFSGYGCNFAFRVSPVIDHDLWFDEDLPLYSWLEDVDFSRRIARHGKLVKSGAMRGVHLGTKTARTPGVRLGYSQIANPVHMFRKGSLTFGRVLLQAGRNVASNMVHSVLPRPYTDFRGRLKGNLIAMLDLVRGQIAPARMLDF